MSFCFRSLCDRQLKLTVGMQHITNTLFFTRLASYAFALSSRVVGEWSCTHRHKETSAATFAPVSAAHRRQQELGVFWGNRDAQTRTFSPRNSQTYLLNPAWFSNMPSKPFSVAQTVTSSRSRLWRLVFFTGSFRNRLLVWLCCDGIAPPSGWLASWFSILPKNLLLSNLFSFFFLLLEPPVISSCFVRKI